MTSQFLAGVGVRDIVPNADIVNNSLHSCMTVRLDERGSPLRAKALALSLGQTTILLVAHDLCSLTTAHASKLRQRISAATALDLDQIIVSCSHSHSTPFVEPLDGPHPYFDFVAERSTDAAIEACRSQRPARIGFGSTFVTGASFNTRVPLADGQVKFTRDFREGLASGRPVDPRLSVIRIDAADGRPLAGWVRFATHPACVIFDAPVSAEYPGYMTDEMSRTVAAGAPVLFGYGASGDVNCVPMFGTEDDSRRLGLSLAALVSPLFEQIETRIPNRLLIASRTIELPLDPVPPVESLDRDIAEVQAFTAALDSQPDLEWVLGINCKADWPVEKKKAHVAPLVEWAECMKQAIAAGREFPVIWPSTVTTCIIDDTALVFYPGEPFTQIGLTLAARSPLAETLLIAMSNGAEGYLGTDEDRRRGGYETYTSPRYSKLAPGKRPLPYAEEAAERLIAQSLKLMSELL